MSEETIHPDAYCTLSNMPCGDLSEALIERDALRARVAFLEGESQKDLKCLKEQASLIDATIQLVLESNDTPLSTLILRALGYAGA